MRDNIPPSPENRLHAVLGRAANASGGWCVSSLIKTLYAVSHIMAPGVFHYQCVLHGSSYMSCSDVIPTDSLRVITDSPAKTKHRPHPCRSNNNYRTITYSNMTGTWYTYTANQLSYVLPMHHTRVGLHMGL